MVVLWDLEWLQGALNVHISLFFRYGLLGNAVKSKVWSCKKGTVWYGMSEEVVL